MALALGSGGARGYAHIGVIEAVQTRGFEIVGITGSSMGAMIGGLQAAGRLDEFADWAKDVFPALLEADVAGVELGDVAELDDRPSSALLAGIGPWMLV